MNENVNLLHKPKSDPHYIYRPRIDVHCITVHGDNILCKGQLEKKWLAAASSTSTVTHQIRARLKASTLNGIVMV